MTHPRNQDGFALIEVIVSAAVLALIALAVLSGIDGATASTARERARAVAASLAEKDQERLRGYRFDELKNITLVPTTVEVQGVTYTITSEATWVVDTGSVASTCADAGNKQNEYMRIVSTVTSSMVGARIQPVKIESLVAAPVSGSLVVKVEPGDPTKPERVANVAGLGVRIVSASDGRAFDELTNAQGCAIFRGIESANYTVRLNKNGYVDRKGQQLSETTATVGAGIVNVLTMSYDKAIKIQATTRTLKPGSTATTLSTKVSAIRYENSDNTGQPGKATANPASNTLTTENLFPFKAGYSLYAGSCTTENPVAVGQNNFFSDANYKAASVIGDPNTFQPQPATVFEPAFNVRVKSDYYGNSATGKVRIFVWLQDVAGSACSDYQSTTSTNPPNASDLATTLTAADWPSALNPLPSGANGTTGWVSSQASQFDPGMPFGTYKLCVYDTTAKRWWNTVTTYNNTSPTGRATTLELGSATQSQWSSGRPSGCVK
jgi:prepilin-type N-terminal cleavage/methylation domain-containing protein